MERYKNLLQDLFRSCPFTIDELKTGDHSSALWAKFRHVENVSELMLKAAKAEGFSEKGRAMAYAAGLFHDIACLNDISLTGKEYGPKHGPRGAAIAYGVLSRGCSIFSPDELETISTAIENHDGAEPAELTGLSAKLTSILRDCDKVDCYRRQSTEPLEVIYQREIDFTAKARVEFAKKCLSGEPIKYSEMRNWNEESLLYLGWFFQLKNDSCRKVAKPLFDSLMERICSLTEDEVTKEFCEKIAEKAANLCS